MNLFDCSEAASSMANALLDCIYPEACVHCGALPAPTTWCPAGPMVSGLRFFDRPHLCLSCQAQLVKDGSIQRSFPVPGGTDLPVWGANKTTSELTDVVGALKYQGIRGLAWPLGTLLGLVLDLAQAEGMDAGWLLPVPLHRQRQRQRGFNQSKVLAEIVCWDRPFRVSGDLASRCRYTDQQAKISDDQLRADNLAGSFSAIDPRTEDSTSEVSGLVLVDDLVTSGATMVELARTLRAQGWAVQGGIALGVAASNESSGEESSK